MVEAVDATGTILSVDRGARGTVAAAHAAGAPVIAQDEATSVVWGMPGAVAQAGLCHAVLPLPRIAPKLLEMLRMARA